MKNRIISFTLAVLMVVSLLPVMAFADGSALKNTLTFTQVSESVAIHPGESVTLTASATTTGDYLYYMWFDCDKIDVAWLEEILADCTEDGQVKATKIVTSYGIELYNYYNENPDVQDAILGGEFTANMPSSSITLNNVTETRHIQCVAVANTEESLEMLNSSDLQFSDFLGMTDMYITGYSLSNVITITAAHDYSGTVTTAPTETTTGTIACSCSKCDGTAEVTLPVLSSEDYDLEVTTPATYTSTGVGTYTWKDTTYGTFGFDVTLPMLTLEAPAVTATKTASSVTLKWNAVEGATGYIIQRKAATGTNWTDYDTTTNLSYTNSAITAGNAYSYRVVAFAGDVATNSSVSADKTLYVGQVTGLAIAQQKKGIKVSWSKLRNASGYKVYRKVSSGDWKLIKTITSGSTVTYTDTASTNVKRNYYKVVAYRTISDVNYTATESATKSLIYVAAPSVSSATNSGSGKITVKWTKNSSATGYKVKLVSSKGTSTYTISSPSTLSKVISGRAKGTYKVYVQAYKTISGTKYYSEWSSYKTVKVTK